MKLEIGDKVILKELKDCDKMKNPGIAASMHQYFDGKTTWTVKTILPRYEENLTFLIEEIPSWSFHIDWVKEVIEKPELKWIEEILLEFDKVIERL